MKRLLPTLVLFLFAVSAFAQFGVQVGANYANMRDGGIIRNKEAVFSTHLGVQYRTLPFQDKDKIGIQYEVLIDGRGFQQKFDEEDFNTRFTYLQGNALFFYSLNPSISLLTGPYFAVLVTSSDFFQLEDFNELDLGWVASASFLDNQILGFYVRFQYGFLPLIDYQRIDELGNFLEEVGTLKNITLSLGVNIKFIKNE